jgi:hypothetical protein
MMPHGFVQTQFRCTLCDDSFEALTGGSPPANPVCMSCGLRNSKEKLARLIAEKKAKQAR